MRVGLVGAGPWATMVHAPIFAAGPETTLAGVWARRSEPAQKLAARFESQAFDDLDALFDASDAVAFCVPPDVQADLAPRAAAKGKPLLLEKPVAADMDAAQRLVDAVDEHDVPTMLVLSWRYADSVRAFLETARAADLMGGRGWFINGGMLEGPFRTPWRLERGPLLDVGPHVLDLLDAALGPITHVHAHGHPTGWVGLLVDHEGGRTSEASLCFTTPVPSRSGVEVYGSDGVIPMDCSSSVGPDAFKTLRKEFADMVRTGKRHELDVHRGLHLQRHIDAAEAQLLGR